MSRYRNVQVPVLGIGARERYLSRALRSFDFLKQVPKEELLAHAHANGMRFATECWHHQLVCFVIAMRMRGFAFFLKQSGGKSKVIIDQIRYRRRRGELNRALIAVPELLHLASWEDQLRTHGPDLKYQIAEGTAAQRQRALTHPADVVLINYAGLMTQMTERIHVTKRDVLNEDGTRKVVGKQVLNHDLAASFMVDHGFNFFDIDEVHRIVNLRSVYYDIFRWCMAACDFRYVMTGTSHGRDPSPLYGQLQLIDDGETFESLGMFYHAFFTPQRHPFKGVVWSFDKSTTSELNRTIKHRSISYEMEEYGDMPKKVGMRRLIKLRGEVLDYYTRIVQGLIEARGDYRSLDNVFIRMRQCASGFIAMKADDDSRIEVEFTENPKLDYLRDFIKSRDEKMLVFHEFRPSATYIERMLESEKIKWAAIRGGTKDIAGEYQRFLTQDSCKIFLLNNQLGAEAINPQYVCRRAVVYESPNDPRKRDQLEKRVHRQGQKWTTWVDDLIMQGTIEEKLLRYNQEGRDLLKAVMTGDESLLLEQP